MNALCAFSGRRRVLRHLRALLLAGRKRRAAEIHDGPGRAFCGYHLKKLFGTLEGEWTAGQLSPSLSSAEDCNAMHFYSVKKLQKEYRRVRSTLFRADTSGPDPDAVHDLPLGLEPGVVHVLEAQAQADDGRGEREGTGSWLHTSIQSEGTDTAASTFWLYKFG